MNLPAMKAQLRRKLSLEPLKAYGRLKKVFAVHVLLYGILFWRLYEPIFHILSIWPERLRDTGLDNLALAFHR